MAWWSDEGRGKKNPSALPPLDKILLKRREYIWGGGQKHFEKSQLFTEGCVVRAGTTADCEKNKQKKLLSMFHCSNVDEKSPQKKIQGI